MIKSRHLRFHSPAPLRTLLFVALIALMGVQVAGCSKKKSDPTFPSVPEPEVHFWFLGLWGSSATDVYAVGQPGLIAHFNGTDWAFENSGTDAVLTDVYSPDGGNTYYVCGTGGLILRKTGGNWSRMDSGTTKDLYGLGSYAGNVHVSGQGGELRRLSGNSWVGTGSQIIVRDANDAPLDTLNRVEDINNLTAVTHLGVGGFDGLILMDDAEWDWQRRLILGGRESIYAGYGNPDVPRGNFLATNAGRVFQLIEKETGLAWEDRTPIGASDESIGGLWAPLVADNIINCYFVNWGGQVVEMVFETLPDETTAITATELLQMNAELTDIWGAGLEDLFVCGRSMTLLRYYDPTGGDAPTWHEYDVTPPAKAISWTGPPVDKFGRPR